MEGDSIMLNERVRDYEVSIWTLQDSFITVLKHSNLENKGQIQDGVMNIKNDNTLELTFSIPMYLYDGPTKKENPIWYNTRNGNIVVNMRKVKVIFNKKTELEEVFEFLITQVAERHEREELYCDVTCEGLAFHELGKIGYKIDLNQDDYIEEWRNWAEEDYENESEHNAREPHNNLEYWADKVLKGTKWSYEISMDWAAYDGMSILRYISDNPSLIDYALIDISAIYSGEDIKGELISYDSLTDEEKARINKMREEKGLRRNDKIYEDEYVSSWKEQDGALIPKEMVKMREKYRLLDKNESNIYNLTQDIAETFGVYCKYVYLYDNDYHIIGRKVVFYNNFIQEIDGELGITYPYEAKTIERTMDSTDIVTKMFVKNLTDSNVESGEASINQVEANRSKEDYLLNFDHFYSIGTISEEQYKEIEPYEAEMRRFNEEIEPLQSQLIEYTDKLTEADAAGTIAKNAISLDTERISATDDLLNALTDGTGRISITAARPDICYIISNTAGSGYCINIRQEGIIGNTIHVYRSYDVSTMYLSDEITGYKKEVDEFGNLTGKLTNFVQPTGSSTVYVIYDYEPQLYYENIKKVWQLRKVKDEQEYKKQKYIVTQLDGEKDENNNRVTDGLIQVTERAIQKLLSDKQNKIYAFERMMGPALREGTWQPEDEYANYGDKYSENLSLTYNSIFNNNLVSIGWDSELFDDEQKSYYELGAALTKKYYPCIDLTNYLDRFTSAAINAKVGAEDLTIENLSFMFQDLEYEGIEDPAYFRFFPVGSECQFAFLRQVDTTNSVIPVLMITGVETLQDSVDLTNSAAHARIGYLKTEVTEEEVFSEIKNIVSTAELQWIPQNVLEKCETVYPRIRINSANVKNTEDELSILKNFSLLSNYEDYSILTRSDSITGSYQSRYYITIKPEVIFRGGKLEDIYKCNFAISNTDLIMYLDAIQVLKENSIPKVSYTIEPSVFNIDFIKQIYKYLNRIVHINDADLKFENVQGYISEIEINLDKPEEDQITITDYKTKFEDLFSTIVAQTEEMKKNSAVIGMTSSLFTTTGQLSSEAIQGVLLRPDLTYAFNQGNLTIDESNGIWATSDSGVVAMRGGGIFTATEQDENGEWMWNTGILPSGINANLITSGQLDTNLIRIYAGDNLKFQLNGKGLFAYKSWLEDNPELGSDADNERTREYLNYALQPAQYVVHNSEGLFLRAKEGARILNDEGTKYKSAKEDVDRVSISWDGLTIRNWDNEKVFYADGQGNLTLNGTIYANAGKFEGDVTAHSLTIMPKGGGEGKDINDFVKDYYDENIENFTTEVLGQAVADLQKQIDGQIETYYMNGTPSLETKPAVDWTTDEEKAKHEGDLYYDKDKGYAYRFFKQDNGIYAWQLIKNDDITEVLGAAIAAQDTADGKRRVFFNTPTPPYDAGDLWVNANVADKYSNDILRCRTGKSKDGAYNINDWILASKYTDDTALNTFVNGAYAQTIEDLHNQDDKKAEIWRQDANPADAWKNPSPEEEKKTKASHVGDIWYCTTSDKTSKYYQRAFIYTETGNEKNPYDWEEMKATPPQDLYDTFDGKVDMYVDRLPTIPYHEGDLWICNIKDDANENDLLVCVKGRNAGEFTRTDWAKKDRYTDDKKIDNFLKADGEWQKYQTQVKKQIDGKAETWRQDGMPSTNWSVDEKKEHIGDMWYCTNDADAVHYQKFWYWNGSDWELTQTDPPQAIFDKLDGKSQIFYGTPRIPYYERDMWVCNDRNDAHYQELLFCIVEERTDKFTRSDWAKKDKYIDQAAANNAAQTAVNSQTQRNIFDKLTKGGTIKGLTIDDTTGNLYVNADYIATGVLTNKGDEVFYLDLDKGILRMKATSLSITSGGGVSKDVGNELSGLQTSVNKAQSAAEKAQGAADNASAAAGKAIISTVQQYYQSLSATKLEGSSWSNTQPAWQQGKYIWNRQYVTYGDGTHKYLPSESGVCITGNTGGAGVDGASLRVLTTSYRTSQEKLDEWAAPGYNAGTWAVESTEGVRVGDTVLLQCYNTTKQGYVYIIATVTSIGSTGIRAVSAGMIDKGDVGDEGIGIASIVAEYYVSNSDTKLEGGSWSTNFPTVQEGKYIWTRQKITYDDAPTHIEYAGQYCLSKTMEDIAQNKIDKQTQKDIFNKLTDNGTLQGLYMDDNQLYINASYLATGVLASKDGETFFLDLDNSILKMKTGLETYIYTDSEGLHVSAPSSNNETVMTSSGNFEVRISGKTVSSLGNKIQKLGNLTIYETADGGHAFI